MDVIERASVCLRDGVEDTDMPIVNDVASAWQRSLTRTRKAAKLGLKSHNAQVPNLSDWLRDTEGDIRNMVHMPEQAQRVLSATVNALGPYARYQGRQMRFGEGMARFPS